MTQYTNTSTKKSVYLTPGQIAPFGPGTWRGPSGTIIRPGQPIPAEAAQDGEPNGVDRFHLAWVRYLVVAAAVGGILVWILMNMSTVVGLIREGSGLMGR